MVKRIKTKKRKRKLNVVHCVPVSPHQCGMYETARELVVAERKLGINAHLYDPRPTERRVRGRKQIVNSQDVKCPKCENEFKAEVHAPIPTSVPAWTGDRGASICDLHFALTSDVIVSHSGLPDEDFKECKIPRIHVAHGRPNSSYRIERSGQTAIYDMYRKMADDPRWKYLITLWPGYGQYWELVFPRVKEFPSFVDLEKWCPAETKHDFGDLGGAINVVVTDIWRMDKDPFHVLNAFVLFEKKHPGAKIHFYGLDGDGRGRDTMINALKERGICGQVAPMVKNLEEVYRAADMMITPHTIATRTVREALACGLNVVAGLGNPFTPYTAYEEDLGAFAEAMSKSWLDWNTDKEACIKRNREMAEVSFDLQTTAKKFIGLFEELTGRAA